METWFAAYSCVLHDARERNPGFLCLVSAVTQTCVRPHRSTLPSKLIAGGEVKAPLSVSIIVPLLNEAGSVAGFLQHVRRRAPDAELIVVDGGSTDGTPEI